ncbi:MAG: NnrS family protein [Fimbriimonadaceae bacterium]|nr:NnrS family protein [Fimbriimonadaceae bacterium]
MTAVMLSHPKVTQDRNTMSVRELYPLRVLPTQVPERDPNGKANVWIYRPFFLAGILSVLTAGCLLGAIALLGIALQGSYTTNIWTPYILAHANSQLFGWVGFFIMGFALQQHPPTIARKQLFHRLAYASLGLMGSGIALRFVTEPLTHVNHDLWVPVGIGSCVLQTIAVLLFVLNTGITRHRRGTGLTWQTTFVFASLAWMLIVSVAEPFAFAFSHQANAQASVTFIAEWFPALREAQFLGFVAMMIFGVALVKMNSCFGFRTASRNVALFGLGVWTAGLLMRIFGWLAFYRSGMAAESGSTYYYGGAVLGSGALFIVAALGIFERPSLHLTSHKFIRAAFAWLMIAGSLMVLEPAHLLQISSPFSHAYTGAIRHAATVGFISQMILGVGIHVVSRLNGLSEEKLPTLWSVFWLLNLGNAARVGLEIGTDYTGRAFIPMGFTGFVELTALSIWAFYMVSIMLRGRRHKVSYAC